MKQFKHIGAYGLTIDNDNILLSDKNDDSLGAQFYDISKLTKSVLSDIAQLEIEKLGYKLD